MSHHLNGRFLHRLHDKWREIERVVTDRRNREFTPRPVQAGRVGIIFRRPSTFYRDCIRRMARSYGVFVIGPAESMLCDTGTMPSCGTRPIVGFMVYSAARPAGQTSEPSVSVPIEKGAYPADTPTAGPEDEPDGFCH
jgi:hypothetical protein